jgi:nitrogen fixation/metabolism regulation signal transduction histidine kinase
MRLRTKIFRQLVLFALIPSVVIALVACYFLWEAIDQASAWLSVSTPDRTINSLRLAETRLQETALKYLSATELTLPDISDTLFDWRMIIEDGVIVESFSSVRFPPEVDSVFRAGSYDPGMIRRVIGDYLIIGASVRRDNLIVAGGYILDREYMNGFRAASASLRENRRFQNLLPGFIMFLLAGGIAVLALIIISAYILSRRLSASVTTPLEYLAGVTTEVAQGNQPQSISVAGTEEILNLAETFNRMIVDLEESRKRLAAAERVAAWQEFARRMAHELKNPLTPISLSLYRIKKSLEESGQYDRYAVSIEAISAEVAHLERMAADYSSLARLPEPKVREFEFTHFVRDLINLHAAQLEKFAFEERGTAEPIYIKGDPDHLHQVMVNLLKNAIEYTPAGGRIIISASDDSNMVSFEVANQGRDVSEADLKAAKMPYFSTREGGTGLGLAVSEKIIIDHGGNLTLGLENGMTVARFQIPKSGTGETRSVGNK